MTVLCHITEVKYLNKMLLSVLLDYISGVYLHLVLPGGCELRSGCGVCSGWSDNFSYHTGNISISIFPIFDSVCTCVCLQYVLGHMSCTCRRARSRRAVTV